MRVRLLIDLQYFLENASDVKSFKIYESKSYAGEYNFIDEVLFNPVKDFIDTELAS